MRERYGEVLRYWLGYKLVVLLSDPDDAEVVFRDTQNLTKSEIYDFLHPWLGTGLLTSTGHKWHLRRKAITPAFHFKILEQFIEVIERQSKILVSCLSKKADGNIFDVHPYASRYSLDVICETAMGTPVNAQLDVSSPYVNAIRDISNTVTKRMETFWLHPNFIFKLFGLEKVQKSLLSILHGFSYKVIAELTNNSEANIDQNEEEVTGIKKKTAFLELLLNMKSKQNPAFKTAEDVREEVDTFMFEGHDTTASALSFALYELGRNPDIQEKAYKEVLEIFGESESITMKQLNELNFLERVIKETLRIYPSVPIIARELSKDIDLPSGYKIPVGTICTVVIAGIHTNKKYFPDPFKFDPDRFLPENMINRHPYSYVPFSAGPRNCIGQKFAMLELKSSLSHVLLKFELGAGEEVRAGMVLTLQSENGNQVWLKPRKTV